ncbi:MAG: DUF2779 domain-containing protein, partial [Coriobacteriales bacterium]|nr:DUF2779 domain-containing protein [Coriobacteriales bacterium]
RHHACLGSTSIKAVLPALVEDLSYEGLAIAEGNTASLAYLRFQTGQTSANETAALFGDLLEYCGTDTLAMVRLLDAVRR